MASRFVLLSTIKYTLTLGLGTDFSVCDLSFKSVAPHLPVDRLYFLLIILTIFYCYMFVCVSVFILLFFFVIRIISPKLRFGSKFWFSVSLFTICYSLDFTIYCFAKKNSAWTCPLIWFSCFRSFFQRESRNFSVSVCSYTCVCVRPCLFRYGFVTERVRAVPWMLVVEYLKVIDLVIVKVNVVQRLVSLQRLEVHLVA